VRWAAAPSARFAHPREEHLLPLMVTFGAAKGDPAKAVFHDKLLGTWVSSFQFGEAS
jgi:aromatic ring-opening dioxygenase catalytic subunit (LigB family)